MAHAHGSMQYPPSPPSDKTRAVKNNMLFYNMGMPGSNGMPVANAMPAMNQGVNMPFNPSMPRDVHGHAAFPMCHSRQISTGQKSESSPDYLYASLPHGLSHGYSQGPTNRDSMSSLESGQTGMTDNSPDADMVTTPLTNDGGSPFSSHMALPTPMKDGVQYTMESILSMFPGTSDVLKSAEIKREQEARKQAGAGKPKRIRKRRCGSGCEEVDDRRRVQNRLSQRSYRERKENTIKTLTVDLKAACSKLAEVLTSLDTTKAALHARDTEHEEMKRQLAACQAMLNQASPTQPPPVVPNTDTSLAASMASIPALPALPAMPTSPGDNHMDATFGILHMGSGPGSSTEMSAVNSNNIALGNSGQLSHEMLHLPDMGHTVLGGFPHGNTPFLASPAGDAQEANASMDSFFATFET